MTDTRARAVQIVVDFMENSDDMPGSDDYTQLQINIAAALADERRRALEEAATVCDERAKYYKGIKSVGCIHDSIAERLADEIRAQAQAGPEEGT